MAAKLVKLCQAALFENTNSFNVAQDQLGVAVVLEKLPRVLLPPGYGRSCRFPKAFQLSGLQDLVKAQGYSLDDSIAEEILGLLKDNQSLLSYAKKAGSDYRAARATPIHATEQFGQFYESYHELCQRWMQCFTRLSMINAQLRCLCDPKFDGDLDAVKPSIRHFEFDKSVLYHNFLPDRLLGE
ncbi:hypothetical protein [uncultured Pseudoteredinibacter sp.]|uniref:hypothetical protein n=1 Tax=uncultured Pseudoteredinibacter sp. TaxID=1641701 RepID=UPI002639D4E2|nr:hypothetical protein [uncultured Pseudoteredinibacter sp.]